MTQFSPPAQSINEINGSSKFEFSNNSNSGQQSMTSSMDNNGASSTTNTNKTLHHLNSMSNLLKNSRLSNKLNTNSSSNSATQPQLSSVNIPSNNNYSLTLTEDSGLPEEVKEVLNMQSFLDTYKAFDLWFTNLNQYEQVTAYCLMLNRLNTNHLPFAKEVVDKQLDKGSNWLKGQLPEFIHNNRESRTIEVDALSKLMEALSTEASQPIIGRNSNRSIYRNSQPVPIDFTRLKARFDPFPDSFLEIENNNTANNNLDFANNSSNFNTSPGPNTSQTATSLGNSSGNKLGSNLTSSLLGPIETLPVSPITRTRPKSMFEPGMMGSIGWKSEQSSPRINGNARLVPPTQSVNPTVGTGVDSVTWAVPISPNYNNFNSNTMPSSSRPIGFTRSEDQIPRSHLGLNSPVIDYTTNVNPSNGVTYNSYHQNAQASQQNTMQSGVNRYTKNSNTRSNNRRSYDYSNNKDNTTTDFFTQGYRHVLGKMPNSIKNHLIKPANRVDFDLLQDIPAWLRSLRLHKYTKHFEGMVWQDVIQLTDEGLADKGVAALGARRKMLKHFDLIKAELNQKNKVNTQ